MGDRPATQGAEPGRGLPAGPVAGRFTVRRFAELDSTNRWVLDQARAGAAEGLVAVAAHQLAGRGRRGRTWEAPPGSSLLVSVLLRPDRWRPRLTLERVHVLTMATALALADAVRAVAGVDAGVKWPNDLVVGERKLAGLLAEAEVTAGGDVEAVVLGAGCNVTQTTFPDALAARATSCAIESGAPVTVDAVLESFLDHLGARLDDLAAVPEGYRARSATIGRAVRVDLGHTELAGLARDVDEIGRLVVERSDGTRVPVAVGDVVHLRSA